MSNTFDVQILVNGSRCKQYQHEGKTFIQANPGSEYVIEIKNNYWQRIEAVSAVDGLNVLNGKTASEADTGYIVDAYHSEKIKGFRFSDEEWALFKFGYKFEGKTYAQSKQDGSDRNCGVIGLRLYYEYNPINYTIQTTVYPQPNPIIWYTTNNTGICTASWSAQSNQASYMSNVQYGCLRGASSGESPKLSFASNAGNVVASNCCSMGNLMASNNSINATFVNQEPKGFDVGTEWGKREKSKVTTVSFSRGYLAHSLDIYYASRESLIEMGVPITNQLKVNLPQSFPSKYATPPSGWVG